MFYETSSDYGSRESSFEKEAKPSFRGFCMLPKSIGFSYMGKGTNISNIPCINPKNPYTTLVFIYTI